jgi:GAF domain-containing protein
VALPDEVLTETLALAGVALTHQRLEDALEEICRIASRAVPAADGASLTSIGPAGPEATSSSSEWSKHLDEMQYDEHEGPCLDAGRTGVLFRVRDTADEPRWPSYMPRAVMTGARSIVSIPLTVEAKTIGALNIYSREPDAFSQEAVALAEIIAGHASLAVQVASALQARGELAEQLREAMASRATIEQAKGMLMAADRTLDPEAAFGVLRAASQRENVKVRDIALRLVERREPPRSVEAL